MDVEGHRKDEEKVVVEEVNNFQSCQRNTRLSRMYVISYLVACPPIPMTPEADSRD